MNSTIEDEQPIISNKYIKCYSDRLVIDSYRFPWRNKTIKYSEIKTCELLPMKDLSIFKYRIWGMAFSRIHWHLDIHRYSRKSYIILDTNNWLKIGITMDDNDINDVYNLIKKNMETNPERLDTTSEKELEYRKSLENNKAKYID